MSKVCPLFSSSSGNSFYIGDYAGGILIDAGHNAKQIRLALADIGVNEKSIHAVFVTHEHSDHVCGLRVFCSQNNIPVYASAGTFNALKEKGLLEGKFFSYIIDNPVVAGNMVITPFHTSHDSVESVGYTVEIRDDRKVAVLTDTGYITEQAKQAVKGSDLVLLESNHDVDMLQSGSYPYVLKRRILSDTGHLSNASCAQFASELIQSGTTRLILGHLSRENNRPSLAYQSTLSTLSSIGAKEGRDFTLNVASPRTTGEVTIL